MLNQARRTYWPSLGLVKEIQSFLQCWGRCQKTERLGKIFRYFFLFLIRTRVCVPVRAKSRAHARIPVNYSAHSKDCVHAQTSCVWMCLRARPWKRQGLDEWEREREREREREKREEKRREERERKREEERERERKRERIHQKPGASRIKSWRHKSQSQYA